MEQKPAGENPEETNLFLRQEAAQRPEIECVRIAEPLIPRQQFIAPSVA